MKRSFLEYVQPDASLFEELWDSCIFVLDANVMINLFRYPEPALGDLRKILNAVKDRLWIPHHAALEFHRNRPEVVEEQKRRFREVRRILEEIPKGLSAKLGNLQLEKLHSTIEPKALETEVSKAVDGALGLLQEMEKINQETDQDRLYAWLETLLSDKIGPAPANQQEVTEIEKDGDSRYAEGRPPGLHDESKDKSSEKAFHHRGVQYSKKFGDLIIWKQLLAYAKEREAVKSVIFVTDDKKEDWWWKSKGDRILGPRHELRGEILVEACVDKFWMYTSDRFLSTAAQHLSIDLNKDSVDQVKEVNALAHSARTSSRDEYLDAIFDGIIEGLAYTVLESDPVIGAMAETNALAYGLDDYEITRAEIDKNTGEIEFRVSMSFGGEQDEDRPWCGDQITVRVFGTLSDNGIGWELSTYQVKSCVKNF